MVVAVSRLANWCVGDPNAGDATAASWISLFMPTIAAIAAECKQSIEVFQDSGVRRHGEKRQDRQDLWPYHA